LRSFDLPPTSLAKPLPAFHEISRDEPKKKAVKSRPTHRQVDDDTPREFARLLNFQKTGKRFIHTLDDGISRRGKKRKLEAENSTGKNSKSEDLPTPSPETIVDNQPQIKILPGERLGEFSARVDQALPIAGLRSKGHTGKVKILGAKVVERQTKHNRRLERMQKQWREEEAKRKDKLEAEMEDKEDEKEEHQLLWNGVKAGGRKKKIKGNKVTADENEDPWAQLEERRRETRQKNLQDVVQAPPQLKGVKSQFNGHGFAAVDVKNVPGSVSGLRKREELGAARKKVIDNYRDLTRRKTQTIKV
jgi:hypothetical protein